MYTAPRGFSQCTTSFFGIRCQGILRAPLIACLLDMENQTLSSNSSLLRVLAVYSSVKVPEQLLNHPWPTTISSPENIVVAHRRSSRPTPLTIYFLIANRRPPTKKGPGTQPSPSAGAFPLVPISFALAVYNSYTSAVEPVGAPILPYPLAFFQQRFRPFGRNSSRLAPPLWRQGDSNP